MTGNVDQGQDDKAEKTGDSTNQSSSSTGGKTIKAVTGKDLGFCQENKDCEKTSFCCSNFSCSDPSVCLHGKKFASDLCSYNFECMSRCCADGTCSDYHHCYKTCKSNSECTDQQEPCCSQGQCLDHIICQGNKVLGDTCSIGSECQSSYCDSSSSICMNEPSIHHLMTKSAVSVLCLAVIILGFCLIYCLCCRSNQRGKWLGREDNNTMCLIGS